MKRGGHLREAEEIIGDNYLNKNFTLPLRKILSQTCLDCDAEHLGRKNSRISGPR